MTVADGAQDDRLHPPFRVVHQHDLNAVVSQLEKMMKALAGRVAALEQEKEKAHSIICGRTAAPHTTSHCFFM